jgi:HAD superfamily hydrolase (TIGR01549 family)
MAPLALFDLDNTLVDRQAAFVRWAERFASDQNLAPGAVEFLVEVDGDGFASRETVFGSTRERYRLEQSVGDLIAEYRASYLEFFGPDPAVTLAVEALRSEGWRVGVVTNGPSTQRGKLERIGLIELIDGLCISDEIGAAKPDRAIFEEAVRRCSASGARPEPVWMVGDTPIPDILGGHEAGLRTIWMHRGRTWPLSDLHPDRTAATIEDAVEHLLLI